jgi:hypothetical protein
MKIFKSQNKTDYEPYMLLQEDIRRTTSDLNIAYINLQNVVEPDLIDYYIYQTKAVQMRYNFLINCAKKLEKSFPNAPIY